MKKNANLIFIFILHFLLSATSKASNLNTFKIYKSITHLLPDSLKVKYRNQIIDHRNTISFNILPIFLQGLSNVANNRDLFVNTNNNNQIIQFQLSYERKISAGSSIEFLLNKKNPVDLNSGLYKTIGAQNPYGEILGMKFSESFLVGLLYKKYLNRFFLAGGLVYRNSWFKNQTIQWGNPAHLGTTYLDHADLTRQDIGLRLIVGKKYLFTVLSNKAIALEWYGGTEIQSRFG